VDAGFKNHLVGDAVIALGLEGVLEVGGALVPFSGQAGKKSPTLPSLPTQNVVAEAGEAVARATVTEMAMAARTAPIR